MLIAKLAVLLIVCIALIIYSGVKLSYYAEKIAGKSRLGRTLVGMVLLAGVTSLPELTTGIVSVAVTKTPDIAIGAVLGSAVFNIIILAIIDPLSRTGPLLSRAETTHIIAATFGIIMLSIVIIGQLLENYLPGLFHFGMYSLVMLILYFVALRFTADFVKVGAVIPGQTAVNTSQHPETISFNRIILHFAKHSVIVVIAASALPFVGEQLSEIAGIGQTFIGSIVIAFITSSPEIVVSVAALRINAVDLAVGNLLGSNIFNLLIIVFDDFLFLNGPILQFVTPAHMFSAIVAIVLSAVTILSLVVRSESRPLYFSNSSWIMIIIYVVYLAFLYKITL